MLFKRQGKWTKIPYVQIFFQLIDVKELCLKYGIVVCPKSESTRQMVLGIDNQEKESAPQPPHEGSPPMAPELPGTPSLYPNVAPYPGALPPQKPTQVCPLVKTGGEFGPTRSLSPSSY